MDPSNIIWSDLSKPGEWLVLNFSNDSPPTHLERLQLPVRRINDEIQVFCEYGQDSTEILSHANQFVADIAMRECIVKRCVVEMDELVAEVICPVLKF